MRSWSCLRSTGPTTVRGFRPSRSSWCRMSSREENRPERASSKARSSDVGWELMGAKLLIRHQKQRTTWRDSSGKPTFLSVRSVELLLQVRKPAGVVGSDGLAVLPSSQVFGEPAVPPGFVLISLSRGSVLGGHLAAPFGSGSNPASVESVKQTLISGRLPALESNQHSEDQSLESDHWTNRQYQKWWCSLLSGEHRRPLLRHLGGWDT